MEKYLVFDNETPIITYVLRKIKRKKMVIYAKNNEDMKKFEPDHVLCYNNKDIAEKSTQYKIKCTNIVSDSKFTFNKEDKNLFQPLVKLFDLEEVKKLETNCNLTFSMLEEVTSQIANNFKPGSYNMINPGVITRDVISQFYGFPTLKGTQNQESVVKGNWKVGLSPIEDFFTESLEKKVNIYIPTYYRFEKTKESLESILNDLEKSQYDVMVYIGDNNTKDSEMRDWLTSLSRHHSDGKVKVEVYLGEKNIGKGMMVNHLYRNSRKCDYLFSIDSDMKVETENFVDKMLFHLTRIQNCGVVCVEQSGLSQHWWGKGVDEEVREGMKVGYSPGGIGVAGGCLCLRTVDWISVGMYRENHDIYTGDDGILTYNVQHNLGKDVVISKDCVMFHPPPVEEEKGYAEWKMESWKRDGLKFLKEGYTGSNTKGYYD